MNTARSIIVVDDDAEILEFLRQSLVLEGYGCSVFTRGEDALGALRENPADVLLADIVLPGMGGLELVREAKQLCPSLTVIVMTGFVEKFSYDEAVRAGAADFIKKPFTAQELVVRIEHGRLQDHLRALSITDELTGLSNRRGFFAFVEQELKHARRTGERLVLFYADLDNLKAVNDTQGHVAGDRVLTDLARILRETFRDSDIIARMGGDEFAVLLGNTPGAGVDAARQRLESRLSDYNDRRDGQARISLSAGAAVFDPARSGTVDDLVREADANMYAEKRRKKKA